MVRAAAAREMSVLLTPPPARLPPMSPLAPPPSEQWQAPIDPLLSMASTSATDGRRVGSLMSLMTGRSFSRSLSR